LDKKIEFNLKDSGARISDSDIHLSIPFTVIDTTSKPNIIISYKSTLGASVSTNLIKEHNTLTNTTTYSGDGMLSANYANIAALDVSHDVP
jgi:hypothetical protein